MTVNSIADRFPEQPAAECERFLKGYSGDVEVATKAYKEHLAWRAANMPMPEDASRLGNPLPEYLKFFPSVKDSDGCPIFFAQPARIDLEKGEPEEYALASAELCEHAVPRESDGGEPGVLDAALVGPNLRDKKVAGSE